MNANQLLADPGDLALRLGVDAAEPLLTLALQRASDRFRGAVGHPVTLTFQDDLILDGNGTDTLLLPASPVLTVSSVKVAGVTVTDYSLSRRSGVIRRRAGWPDDLGNVEVVYTHGYPDVPGDIQDAVLEQAETLYLVLAGIDTATAGGESVSFGRVGTVGVTQRWSDAVTRYQLGRGDRA